MWFDTHCHLDAEEFDRDREAVIEQAALAGVRRVVVPAVAVSAFPAVAALCAQPRAGIATDNLQKNHLGAAVDVELLPAYGIHPMYTPKASESDLITLREWLKPVSALRPASSGRPVAVGEIGLDGFVPGLDLARQEFYFVEQLKLAAEFDLPVILHIRRSQDLVLKHLRRFQSYFRSRGAGRAGIAHAFNGSTQQAEIFMGLGFLLGFGGAMTYDGSSRIRKLAADLPLESIVLETDSPDIPPSWLSGQRNAPAELPRMASVLAALRGVTPEVIAEATTRNACQLFKERCN